MTQAVAQGRTVVSHAEDSNQPGVRRVTIRAGGHQGERVLMYRPTEVSPTVPMSPETVIDSPP
eukprot:7418882-Alexandrium_andersonii.AAC.1